MQLSIGMHRLPGKIYRFSTKRAPLRIETANTGVITAGKTAAGWKRNGHNAGVVSQGMDGVDFEAERNDASGGSDRRDTESVIVRVVMSQ